MGKLYVSNLPFKMTDADLKAEFESIGSVIGANIVLDKETGRSRGFGFVEMEKSAEAMEKMNGANIDGRNITVSPAREREDRGRRGGREQNNLNR